jgi:hypothetical protein
MKQTLWLNVNSQHLKNHENLFYSFALFYVKEFVVINLIKNPLLYVFYDIRIKVVNLFISLIIVTLNAFTFTQLNITKGG